MIEKTIYSFTLDTYTSANVFDKAMHDSHS